MPLSNSILSYADCKDLCDRALASERGIKFQAKDSKAANRYMQRLNQHRRLDRNNNRRVFTEDDPLYGRSAYDNLEFRARDAVVEILKISSRANELKIEELTNEEVTGLL
jgi:hypothetical protein